MTEILKSIRERMDKTESGNFANYRTLCHPLLTSYLNIVARYEAWVRDNTWDAVLSIFSGDCGSLTCLGFEEQCFVILPVFPFVVNCDFGLSFTGIAGQTYYLAVSGQDG